MEEIVNNLSNENSAFAKQTLKTLASKSPTSLKLELECIKRGKSMNIQQVKEMDYNVAMQYVFFYQLIVLILFIHFF